MAVPFATRPQSIRLRSAEKAHVNKIIASRPRIPRRTDMKEIPPTVFPSFWNATRSPRRRKVRFVSLKEIMFNVSVVSMARTRPSSVVETNFPL